MTFFMPKTLEAAVDLLAGGDPGGRVLAGGTTFMLDAGRGRPGATVALQAIDPLRALTVGPEALEVGSMVTLQRLVDDPRILAVDAGLRAAVASVGNIRVRNMATLGGSVVTGTGAPDALTALVGLDASVHIATTHGATTVPVAALDRALADAGPAGRIVSRIDVPVDPARVSTYVRYVARSRPDRPSVAVFASVHLDADGQAHDVRVCVGAAVHPPVRFADLEQSASADGLGQRARRSTAEDYAERIEPIDDHRGSAWYRSQLIVAAIERALATLEGAGRGATGSGRA